MSVDGRDEQRPEGGGTSAGSPPSRQVPSQGGPGRTPAEQPDPQAPALQASVPSQRESGSSGGGDGEVPSSDADLIGRMRAGDDSAYEELYRRHSAAVRRYARTCC